MMRNRLGLCSIMEQQSLSDNTSVHNVVTEYFKPTLEKKKDSFANIPTDNAPGHPKALVEMCSEMNFASVPASTTSTL